MLHHDSHDAPDQAAAGIAVVGLAGRFPGAEDVEEFWRNLLDSRESVRSFRRDELARGESADDPEYVPRRGVLDQAEWLDAAFFGMNRIEAEVTDPQHRVFLEVAWSALEHAGYDPHRLPGICGVWAGTGNNHYFQRQLAGNSALLEAAGAEAVMIGNEKDYLATRVAYRLNLRGPAINVVTACSTSLVAVAQAVHGLMTFQCDMALAGGASVRWPQNRGYLHEDGGIVSPDGHCRAFDEKSAGTVFSSGAGCVVLKRVADAVRDGDTIFAVIKSAALNNDGAGKASFTAPGVDGQAENIKMALALADTPAASIDFVEAHGTGTALGDVIEVAALTQAFRAGGDARLGGCVLGSLKPSTGHMDAAAGVGGLIKASLSLYHGVVPGTLHFTRPNPRLALEHSPFRVSAVAVPLAEGNGPHHALVAALGIGGTNAHLVLESAPRALRGASRDHAHPHPLVLSARSAMALAAMQDRLAGFLETHPDVCLTDVAFTLARGRSQLAHRSALVATTVAEAVASLRAVASTAASVPPERRIALMFPGQGSQHAGMGRELAEKLPEFRSAMAECCEHLGFDPLDGSDEELERTSRAQPALFVIGYALARQFEAWGIRPDAYLGHSIGEYVAATLAGVFSLGDALRLVLARGRAMQAQPCGVMLAVRTSEADLALPETIDLAAVNAPRICVVSGSEGAIAAYETACIERGLGTKRLRTSHAFHSRLMEGALEDFRRAFDGLTLRPPDRPVISNVTGTELTGEQATSPDYWVRHLRNPVRFAAGVLALKEHHVLLEAGPSDGLTQLARQSGAIAVAAMPPAMAGGEGELRSCRTALGHLWMQGVNVDWSLAFPDGSGCRIALPTYPFERQRFCPDSPEDALEFPDTPAPRAPASAAVVTRTRELSSLQPLFGSTETSAPARAAISRQTHLVRELQLELLRISGVDIAAHPTSTPFLELGLDSLFLTQAGIALKRHFGIKITFRQLMEDLTSVEALARHLDAHLAPGQFDPAAADPFVVPETIPQTEAKSPHFGPFRPIDTNHDGSLTPVQRAHLDRLIADYTAKYPKSKAYTAHHRSHFADPRAVSGFNRLWKEMVFPAIVECSAGAHLWDIDGNAWIDVVHGFGSGFFGHRPDFVVEALKAQLNCGIEIGPTHPLAGEVAHMIKELSGQDRVAFCNTGSESLMAAIRVARTVTGRDKIVMFSGAYHGIFDEVLARPLVVNGELRAIPIAPGIPESALVNILVLEYGHPESLEIIARHAHELAAVLVEPVPSRRPEIAPVEFVQELRRITALHETALIFDEVVLGWRTGLQGAQKHFGIDADLVAFGKVLGGGLPLGVLAGKRRFMDALDGGAWNYGDDSAPETGMTFFAGTFIRHPLALAACKAVLDRLLRDGPELQLALDSRTAQFVEKLNSLFAEARVPVTATCFSSLWMLHADAGLKFFSLLFYHLRLRGIHMWEGRGNFLSTAHTEAHCAGIVHAVMESVQALQHGGFFPHGEEADGLTVLHADQSVLRPAGGAAGAALAPAAPEPPTIAAPAAEPSEQPAAGDRWSQAATTLPLTPEQQEVLLASLLSPQASVAAHESVTIHLHGSLDRSRLERALQSLAERHESLRVSLARDGSHQRVASTVAPRLRLMTAAPLERVVATEFLEPFDLAEAPLWRAAIVEQGPDHQALVLTAHHLICDGWSFGVIAHDLPRLYRGESLSPAITLRDVATAARDGAAEGYWRNQFASPPAPVELPTEQPRALTSDLAARALDGSIPDALAESLRDFCGREKATLNAVLLAAWQLLLHRLTGSRDIIVGTPIAGQLSRGLTAAVAHQVHFLPLRITLDSDLTAGGLIARTRGALADATDNQDFTLGQLYQAMAFPRPAGRPSFVTTTFTCENAPASEDWGDGLEGRLESNPKHRLAFDASMFFSLDGDALRWRLVYQESLFQEQTVAQWMRCLETLLQSMIDHPDSPVDQLELLAPADAQLLHSTWNRSGQPRPPSLAIHELFEMQVDQTPEAPALLWHDSVWTYRQLDDRANQFAHELLAAGLRPAQKVALVAERSPQLVAAVLGILKAGGSYAPVDTNYPNARIGMMLRDLGSTVLACDPVQRERLEHLLGHIPATLVEVTSSAAEGWRGHRSRPEIYVPPSAPAYIIYTSGSTGQPKGMVIPHRAVVRLVQGQEFATMTSEQTWLQLAPLSFDACTLELFAPLLHGARLALMPPGTSSLPGIGAAVRRYQVTSLWLTAGLFQVMVDERLDDLEPVQELFTGGDVVSVSHARRVLQRFPHLRLVNGYGPTENTTFTCCHDITPEDLDRPTLPIGHPVAHTSVFIVDENDQPCPVGVAGELLAGGQGLALGYWRREELTAEKFVDHARFGRVYRTGDRARWRWSGDGEGGPRGVIEFLGRFDSQIKVRGFRIEPGEIEAALVSHPGVSQAVVRARGGSAGDRRLVAWCVPAGVVLPAMGELRAHLRSRLPDFMVPLEYVCVPTPLPLTAHGKLDERALPAPDLGGGSPSPTPEIPVIAPRTDAERRIHRLMQATIGHGQFGVRDDFFDLGGDSLRGLGLFNMIEREFGRGLALGTLFAAPTVEKLARILGGGGEILPAHVIPIQPHGEEPPLFLIHGGDGGVMFYRKAVARLGADQPVYGLEAPMLTDATLRSPGPSIEAVSEEYLSHIREIQPSGPYRLGGYSFGGVVAYEMARQLRDAGETVEHLMLFDTDNPSVSPRYFSRPGRVAARWRMDRAAGQSLARCMMSLVMRLATGLRDRRLLARERAAVRSAQNGGIRAHDMLRPLEIREASAELMRAYVPSQTDASLTLFRCRDLNDKFEHTPALGWEVVVRGDLEVIPITGTHLQLFEDPHVDLLAQRLSACLRHRPVPVSHQVLELVPA